MPTDGTDKNSSESLLAATEPQPFVFRNPEATAPILLVCDHASYRFPQSLGSMGLDPAARRCHLALDIGAAVLTDKLAESLGVAANCGSCADQAESILHESTQKRFAQPSMYYPASA